MEKKSKSITIFIIGIIIITSGIIIGVNLILKNDNPVIYHPPTEERKYSFYHYIPKSALKRSSMRILLYGHSSPYVENYKEMEECVRDLKIPFIKPWCENYGYALIVIVTPRLWGDYPDYKMNTQQMNRWVMFENDFDKPEYEFYKRPDLEFIKAIDDFKQLLTDKGYIYDEKVYMMGHSNGGAQANRFPLLHPDQIKATASGAAGGYLYPMSIINNTDLSYPVGISDIDLLSEVNFNLTLFKSIPHLIFIGENDTLYDNDPVVHDDCYDQYHRNIILTYFGTNNVERAKNYSNYLNSIGMDCIFNKYQGIGHEKTSEMMENIFEFFEGY